MNALTSICPAPAAEEVQTFYEAIAAERDSLSHFLRRPSRTEIGDIIEVLAAESKPIIFIGIGKSGHIASKIAATFCSLDKAALFLNAAEAGHGDLGVIQPCSVVVILSNSGSSDEVTRLLPSLRARQCTLVAIVGREASPLARASHHMILAQVSREADPLGMAPTCSTTLQLAIGDALAVCVSQAQGFTKRCFLQHHPAGLLGQHMIPVAGLMRREAELPIVRENTPLLEVLTEMSAKRLGAACVVGDGAMLLGLIVDGDVRRYLQAHESITEATAGNIMQSSPRTVLEDATLGELLATLEHGEAGWLVMPVVDNAARLKGVLHIQDVLG